MRFARPEMLFFIWAVPLALAVFWYGMRRRKRILSGFASAHSLKAIAPARSRQRRWLKAGLIGAAILWISLALAGPQYGYHWREIERKGVDLIIALDCSRSMLATDISPSRLDRAKREVYDLIGMMKGDRLGLVAFAGTAFMQCPLTLDYGAFHLFLQNMGPDFMPVGGTNLVEAITVARQAFDPESPSEKAMILITDGEHTGPGDPLEAAQQAKQGGIRLFCIGVGSQAGVPVPAPDGGLKKDKQGNIVISKLDEKTLKKMAVLTQGGYVRSVAGDMDLDAIYQTEIRGKMEQQTLESGRKRVWEDRYQWPLLLAVLALGAELFISARKKGAGALVLALCLLAGLPVPSAAGPLDQGLLHYKNGQYEKALKQFIDAQLEDPDNPRILYNIGNAYYRLEEYEKAADNFQSAAKAEQARLKQKSLYNLGNARFRQGSYEKALESYQQALAIAPDDPQAKENIAFVKKVIEAQKKQQKQPSPSPGQEGERQNSPEKSAPNSDQPQKGDPSPREDSPDRSQAQSSDSSPDGSPDPSPDPSPDREDGAAGSDTEPSGQQQRAGKQPAADPQKADSKDGDAPSVEYGKKMAAPEEGPASQPAREKGPREAGGQAASGGNPGQKGQAARILNRLEDKPGQALIPGYGKQPVEKDW